METALEPWSQKAYTLWESKAQTILNQQSIPQIYDNTRIDIVYMLGKPWVDGFVISTFNLDASGGVEDYLLRQVSSVAYLCWFLGFACRSSSICRKTVLLTSAAGQRSTHPPARWHCPLQEAKTAWCLVNTGADVAVHHQCLESPDVNFNDNHNMFFRLLLRYPEAMYIVDIQTWMRSVFVANPTRSPAEHRCRSKLWKFASVFV